MEENTQTSEEKTSNHQDGKLYKIGFFIFFSLFLIFLGVSLSWYYFTQYRKETDFKPTPTIVAEQPTSIISSPTIIPQETVTITKETPSMTAIQKSDLEQIKEAMAEKHSKPLNETIINISKNTGNHASGGVKFEGEIAGGWFLAAKKDGKWVIVDDGNGTISCEVIEPWDFPNSIVSECVNELGNPVSR